MRRTFLLIATLLATLIATLTLFLASCMFVGRLLPAGFTFSPPVSSPPVSPLPVSSPPVSSPPLPSATPQNGATRTALPLATLTATPDAQAGFSLRFHPDGGLYVGDEVSMEVIAPDGTQMEDSKVRLTFIDPGSGEPLELGTVSFGRFGIAGRYQATLWWAWDTSGLDPGVYRLGFAVLPDGPAWEEPLVLQPAQAVPPPEWEAHWAEAKSQYCRVNYITGTAAERDLPELLEMLDRQALDASQRLNTEIQEPIPIVLLPRVLGHGGFTGEAISVSYLDRNYAGSLPEQVVHHEMVHLLDARLGGELRPTLFVEGLAVYLSGGHFKPEALGPRAAALVDLGKYIPLPDLLDNFYASQHEIGYLEAAALIEYMVDTWGWEGFSAFYRDIHPDPSGRQGAGVETALQKHFKIGVSALELRWLESLHAYPVTQTLRDDVRLTIDFYDTVRRYQQALDPSAYFMTAWLPDSKRMRERGIVGDFLRHPQTRQNLALETMLIAGSNGLVAGSYAQTERLLQAANAVLDGYDQGLADPFWMDPLAADYEAVVQVLQVQGYQPQQISMNGETAHALFSDGGTQLSALDLVRVGSSWKIRTKAASGSDQAPILVGIKEGTASRFGLPAIPWMISGPPAR